MVIDTALPSFYPVQTAVPANTGIYGGESAADKAGGGEPLKIYYPGVIVDISPEAKDAYNRANPAGTAGKTDNGSSPAEALKAHECQTCKNRKYQDDSNDSSVSFQAPTHLSPGQAATAVAAHEGEHVAHEQARAEREDRQVVSQTVTLHTSICPECGRIYISGGVTRTVTADKPDNSPETQGKIPIKIFQS